MAKKEVKRVFMTADTVGGVWTYAVELIRALGEHGIEVALASMGKSLDSDQKNEIRSLRNVELFESRYKLEWMRDPWEDVDLAGEWLLAISQCIQPDLVHLNGYSHGCLDFGVPKLITAHSCVYSWFESVKKSQPDQPLWAEYHKRVSEGLSASDYIVAPTAAMLDSLSRLYGISFRGKVISNGRGRSCFVPRIKDPMILTAGRLWDEAKNLSSLESVAQQLPWKVYAAGDGLKRVQSGFIHWLGKCSPSVLASWMSKASIYALPARYEPFGLSVLEAALSGCALVLGDIPSLRELWEDCALFVDPGDTDALQSTILTFIDQPWLRREYSERARKRALQFTPDKMARAYVQLYSELVNNSNEGRGPQERTLCA
ncbi:MAG: glycosyltransferase family 4 protein [Chitinispirillaceae bacterium]